MIFCKCYAMKRIEGLSQEDLWLIWLKILYYDCISGGVNYSALLLFRFGYPSDVIWTWCVR